MSLYERTTAPHTSRNTTQERPAPWGRAATLQPVPIPGCHDSSRARPPRRSPTHSAPNAAPYAGLRRAAETAWVRSRLFLSVAAVFHSSR